VSACGSNDTAAGDAPGCIAGVLVVAGRRSAKSRFACEAPSSATNSRLVGRRSRRQVTATAPGIAAPVCRISRSAIQWIAGGPRVPHVLVAELFSRAHESLERRRRVRHERLHRRRDRVAVPLSGSAAIVPGVLLRIWHNV
jgi:hypothetical protein